MIAEEGEFVGWFFDALLYSLPVGLDMTAGRSGDTIAQLREVMGLCTSASLGPAMSDW